MRKALIEILQEERHRQMKLCAHAMMPGPRATYGDDTSIRIAKEAARRIHLCDELTDFLFENGCPRV